MHVYGLTGGIATGKSTVSRELEKLGCPVIDADVIERQVMEPGKPSWKLIIYHFGVQVRNSDGRIDRPKLLRMIFEKRDKKLLNKYSMCIAPYIKNAILWEVVKCFFKGEKFVVLVTNDLFESGMCLWLLKKKIVVKCSHQQELERLMNRDQLTEEEALQRLDSQMPLTEKCRKADVMIDNSQDREHTRQQVARRYDDMMKAPSYHWVVRWTLFAGLVMLGFLLYHLIFICSSYCRVNRWTLFAGLVMLGSLLYHLIS